MGTNRRLLSTQMSMVWFDGSLHPKMPSGAPWHAKTTTTLTPTRACGLASRTGPDRTGPVPQRRVDVPVQHALSHLKRNCVRPSDRTGTRTDTATDLHKWLSSVGVASQRCAMPPDSNRTAEINKGRHHGALPKQRQGTRQRASGGSRRSPRAHSYEPCAEPRSAHSQACQSWDTAIMCSTRGPSVTGLKEAFEKPGG